MVDSVKQYNLAGVASEVELGKAGAKIDGANSSDQVALKKNDDSLAHAEIDKGVNPHHAVTLEQLETVTASRFSTETKTVSYNDGNVAIGTFEAGTTVFAVAIEKGAGNWVGADSNTNITVGVSSDPSLLFSHFDPTIQSVDETNHEFTSQAAVNAYVSSGGASSGTATIIIQYAGNMV